ncbi:MAG: hypothetical protein U9P44_03895 [archaeon]|nr:hypothetical protein [archaeon]
MDTNGTRCFLNFSTDAIDKGASVELVNTSCTSIDFTADCLEFDKAVVSTTCGVVAIFTDASDVSCNIA